MSQSNFIIQDVVEHVYREKDYGSPRIILDAVRRIMHKLWIFIIIIGISAGIGYVAVYLPDSASRNKTTDSQGIQGIPSDLQSLTDEQKLELLKQFKGQ